MTSLPKYPFRRKCLKYSITERKRVLLCIFLPLSLPFLSFVWCFYLAIYSDFYIKHWLGESGIIIIFFRQKCLLFSPDLTTRQKSEGSAGETTARKKRSAWLGDKRSNGNSDSIREVTYPYEKRHPLSKLNRWKENRQDHQVPKIYGPKSSSSLRFLCSDPAVSAQHFPDRILLLSSLKRAALGFFQFRVC